MRSAGRMWLAAALVGLALAGLRPAQARAGNDPDTLTFRTLPARLVPRGEPSFWARHRTPLLVTGATLTAATLVGSQLLLRSADDRYRLYGAAVNPADVSRYYDEARTRDRWSNALVVTGEAAAAATLYLAWRGSFDESSPVSLAPRTDLPGFALRFAWGAP